MEYNLEKAIEQMKAGEEAGLNYVYSKTYNFVYLRAKSIFNKEEDAQQLMKEILSKLSDESVKDSFIEKIVRYGYDVNSNSHNFHK